MPGRDGICKYRWCQQAFPEASMRRHMLSLTVDRFTTTTSATQPGPTFRSDMRMAKPSISVITNWTTQSGASTHQACVRKNGWESDENHAEKERNKRGIIPGNIEDVPPGNVEDALPPMQPPVTPQRPAIVRGNVWHGLPPPGLVVPPEVRALQPPVTPQRPPPGLVVPPEVRALQPPVTPERPPPGLVVPPEVRALQPPVTPQRPPPLIPQPQFAWRMQ
ncbi:hypothetical protein FN846DRAFT_892737 [Sphaerosporella brunnea]|uniref:Uncharacterized protein n=1 Tax=Sphaerosporella brunnea TaxID=1250544 RepID=A0A5J5EMZ9_9PEZI|nr:hypothetical protein FN846DRAFT_892737 [Sphaerosporella brunnea]